MGVSIDLLSSLPDSLLSIIVSCLPFKDAVRTSILSKDWKNVCKSTKNIEFNELFFIEPYQYLEVAHPQKIEFVNFVRKWIKNRPKNDIDKLTLKMSNPTRNWYLIDKCLEFAIKNEVKKLEVDFSHTTWNNETKNYDIFNSSFKLSTCVYGYNGLESLKLYSCDFVASEMVNFHSLKEIYLGFMSVALCSIKALLTNCEVLESLSFTNCWNSDDGFDLNDEYLRLKKLVIKRCNFKYNIFRVNAQNLKIFKYYGLMLFTNTIIDISSCALDEVNLEFGLEQRFKGQGRSLYKFLKEFSSVKVLTVCSYLLQVIYTGGPKRMYRRMSVKHLTMKTTLHKFEFMGITFLLNSCPCLERLTIEICEANFLADYEKKYEIIENRYWDDNNVKVLECMKKNLKVIEIKGFKGTKNERNLINYFIMHGKSLRKLSIIIQREDCGENGPRITFRREVARAFQMLPQASPFLKISINELGFFLV